MTNKPPAFEQKFVASGFFVSLTNCVPPKNGKRRALPAYWWFGTNIYGGSLSKTKFFMPETGQGIEQKSLRGEAWCPPSEE
jgi:hypothetical protein